MFIQNQTFKDEDTLMEMLFDFSLGSPSSFVQDLIKGIDADLEANTAYNEYKGTLQDEDDRTELYIEERDLRLAEIFMQQFDSFAVQDAKLYGVKAAAQTLLYEIDLL